MNKEVYISEFNATSINEDECGVIAKIVFKDTLTLDEIKKIKNKTYLELTDSKENIYKQALNEIRESIYKNREHYNIYSTKIEDWMYIKDKDILQIIDKVLGDEK